MHRFSAYRLTFFVPMQHAEAVKDAVFAAGAGKEQGYKQCSWEVLGVGQFIPQEGSTPYIGTAGKLERVPELRVEMICPRDKAPRVIDALIAAHPYEVPAYDLKPIHRKNELL